MLSSVEGQPEKRTISKGLTSDRIRRHEGYGSSLSKSSRMYYAYFIEIVFGWARAQFQLLRSAECEIVSPSFIPPISFVGWLACNKALHSMNLWDFRLSKTLYVFGTLSQPSSWSLYTTWAAGCLILLSCAGRRLPLRNECQLQGVVVDVVVSAVVIPIEGKGWRGYGTSGDSLQIKVVLIKLKGLVW